MEFRDPFAAAAQPSYSRTQAQATTFDAGLRAYMLRIYNYMASALALTGLVAYGLAASPEVLSVFYKVQNGHIYGMSGLGWLAFFAPFGLAMWLGAGLTRMRATTAQAIYWAFAVVIGISLTPIVFAYTGASIARTFFVTAGTFGTMSLIGYTTKRDLTGMGHFLMMGVWGIFLAMLVNMFLHSPGVDFAISVLGVVIFTGLTAYDTQKLKDMYYQLGATGEMLAKVSIIGALNLYLDFINMFVFLLRFLGDRR